MAARGESSLSVVFALLVHGLIGAGLFVTWDTDVTRFEPQPNVINATVLTVDASTAPQAAPAKSQPEVKPAPVTPKQPSDDLKRQQAEDKAQIETQKKRELQERREREAEQKRQQEQAKQEADAKAAEQKAKAEAARKKAEQAKAKAEAEKKAAEEAKRLADKKRAEAEKAKREAQERAAAERAKRLAEEERKKAAAAAEAARVKAQQEAEAQAQAAIASERLARSIVSAIDQKVRRNWRLPAGSDQYEVHLRINMAPTGDVLAVNVAKSSGSANFDNSARNALKRSSPFREMRELSSREFEQNFRQFTMIFRPGAR